MYFLSIATSFFLRRSNSCTAVQVMAKEEATPHERQHTRHQANNYRVTANNDQQ